MGVLAGMNRHGHLQLR